MLSIADCYHCFNRVIVIALLAIPVFTLADDVERQNWGLQVPAFSTTGNFTLTWQLNNVGYPTVSPQAEKTRLYQRFNDGSFELIETGPAKTDASLIGVTTYSFDRENLQPGIYRYYVENLDAECPVTSCILYPQHGGTYYTELYTPGHIKTVVVYGDGDFAGLGMQLTRGGSPDQYTVSWSDTFDERRYVLLEGVSTAAQASLTDTIGGWREVQRGGHTYSTTGQAGGRYAYQLAEYSMVMTPGGSIPYYVRRSDVVTFDVLTAPGLEGPETSLGNHTVAWNPAGQTVIFEAQAPYHYWETASLWEVQTATRFNVVTGLLERDYNNLPGGQHRYRARAVYPECSDPLSIELALLSTLIGAESDCFDEALTSELSVTVNYSAPDLELTQPNPGISMLHWDAPEYAPISAVEQFINGQWMPVYSGIDAHRYVQATDDNYRVKFCETEALSRCSSYAYFEPSDLTPKRAPFPEYLLGNYGNDNVGSLAGQFRVNEAGAATYSIPILTGTGTAGVVPEVSLNYSSQAGNGIAGKGWSVSGGSAITRCRQTLQIDGIAKPITWSDEDRFCLDGQRLLVMNGGTYGSSGVTYKTEIDSFTRVTSHGGTGGHPSYFTVERKDGSIAYYGARSSDNHREKQSGAVHTDSQQRNSAGNTLTWAVTEFYDSMGNPIKFKYHNDADGFVLERIDYAFGSSASETTNTYIEFQYTTRPDPIKGYQAGYLFSNTRLLESIQSYSDYGGDVALLRSYHLAYEVPVDTGSPSDATTSRLASIKECARVDAECLPATVFNWALPDSSSAGLSGLPPISRSRLDLAGDQQGLGAYTLFDFNGDGLKDIAWMVVFPDSGGSIGSLDQKFYYAKATSSGFEDMVFAGSSLQPGLDCGTSFEPTCYRTSDSPNNNGAYRFKVIDYNADGRDDLLRHREQDNTWSLFLSVPQADGSWRLQYQAISLPFSSDDTMFADINSDGLVDAIDVSNNAFEIFLLERDAMQSSSSPMAYHFTAGKVYTDAQVGVVAADQRWTTIDHEDSAKRMVDINGDGRLDVVSIAYRLAIVATPDAPSCVLHGFGCVTPTPTYGLRVSYLDDATLEFDTHIVTEFIDNSLWSQFEFETGDINGDGLADILTNQNVDPNLQNAGSTVILNRGLASSSESGWEFLPQSINWSDSDPQPGDGGDLDFEWEKDTLQLLDLNSDGFADVYWYDKVDNRRYISYWQPTTQLFSDPEEFSGLEYQQYSYQNVDNDASLELVVLVNDAGSDRRNHLWIYELNSLPEGHDNIHTIINGLGAITSVTYEALTQTDHYHRVEGISDGDTETHQICYLDDADNDGDNDITVCQDYEYLLANADDFYQRLNDPFHDLPAGNTTLNPERTSPILEVFSPTSVVTRVESSAPAANDDAHSDVDHDAMSAISYIYHQAKIQAAGRGYLGFKKIETVDEQTGIVTTTEYRQDFPFVGMPLKTTTALGSGEVLSEASNTWGLNYANNSSGNFPDAATLALAQDNGCHVLGPLQPVLSNSVEQTYSTLTTTVSPSNPYGLTVSSSVLQSVETTNTYDIFGNVTKNIVKTREGDVATGILIKRQRTTNSFKNGNSDWSDDESQRLGRLWSSTVLHRRFGDEDDTQSRTSSFDYYAPNAGGLLKTETIEQGHTSYELETNYTYDNFGNKATATQTALDARNGTGAAPANDRQTRWVFDNQGRYLIHTYNALNQLVETVADRNTYGAPTRVVDINFVETRTEYTPMGKPYLQYADTGAWQQTVYEDCAVGCPSGAVYRMTTHQAGGASSTEYFDVLGRTIQTEQQGFAVGDIITTQTEYDTLGRVKRQSTPYYHSSNRYWAETTYDILGRPLEVLTPTEQAPIKQHVVYNGLRTITQIESDNLTAMLDSSVTSQYTVRDTNVLGEVMTVRDALNGTVIYTYSAEGLLRTTTTTSHSNGGGEASGINGSITISLTYDDLGRKISMSDPDKGDWTYEYNGFGELIEQIDANGNATYMDYDKLGRLIKREDWREGSPSNGTQNLALEGNTTWVFDTARVGLGKLDVVQDTVSGYQQSYQYDSLGRQTGMTTTTGTAANDATYSTQTVFDSLGRTQTQIDATGHSTRYHYNAQGYLEKVVEEPGGRPYFTVTDMTARGQVSGLRWGNGFISLREYDFARGLPKRLRTTNGIHDLQNWELKFDDFGNLISRLNQGVGKSFDTSPQAKNQREEYRYDALNRLRKTYLNDLETQSLTYDSFGNIKNKSDVGDYTYGNNAGPHAVTATSDGVTYQYDANGNMTSDSSGRTLEYSSFDKPTRITKGNHEIGFSYAPNRARYKRVDINADNNAVNKTTLYMGNVERISYNDGTVEHKRYIDGSILVSDFTDTQGITTSKTQYLIKDHLGSTELVITPFAQQGEYIKEEMSFDAWGHRRGADLTNIDFSSLDPLAIFNLNKTTTRGYTGHEMLDEVGLIHMNGRVYDPRLARFMQADPKIDGAGSTQGYNRYAYGANNPNVGIDPTGYGFRKFVGAIVAIVGGIICGPACAQFGWQVVAVGALAGAAGAAANGGNIFKGALLGGVSAAAFSAIGSHYNQVSANNIANKVKGLVKFAGNKLTKTQIVQQIAAHSIAGGVFSVLHGGKFGHGFVSAGFSKGATGSLGFDFDDKSTSAVVGRTTIAAIIGGTASEISGGKFANGAVTAALAHLFNAESWKRSNAKVQDEKLAVGVGTKALSKVLGIKGAELGIEFDSKGNVIVESGVKLKQLEITLNSDLEATIVAGPEELVGTSFSVGGSDATSKAVAEFGLVGVSVAGYNNGVVNFDIRLGSGISIQYSGGFDIRKWGVVGQIVRSSQERERSINNYICNNFRSKKGC